MNAAADAAPTVLPISIDAKATVKVGRFARGGKRRAETKACDHDFKPQATVTPVGIFLPASDELFVYGIISKVTSDCLVDRLVQCWESVRERFGYITTLVINAELYDQYDLEWHPPSGGSGHHDLSHWRPVIPAGHGCN